MSLNKSYHIAWAKDIIKRLKQKELTPEDLNQLSSEINMLQLSYPWFSLRLNYLKGKANGMLDRKIKKHLDYKKQLSHDGCEFLGILLITILTVFFLSGCVSHECVNPTYDRTMRYQPKKEIGILFFNNKNPGERPGRWLSSPNPKQVG